MATFLEKPSEDTPRKPLIQNSKILGHSGVPVDWLTLLPFILSGMLLIALSWRMLAWWKYEFFDRPESYYGHAPIIPVLAGLMLWHRRKELASISKSPSPIALTLLIPALALLVIALNSHMEAVESAAFLLTIVGAVWLALGGQFLRAVAFPLAFLWLMAPLPGPVLNDATQRIQMLSTVLADKLLNLGFHTTLEGNIITMDEYRLFVDVPCSGFKTLLAMLTFSAAFAYLVDGKPARRWVLFLFSLPLALAVNGIRIALIGVVGECMGSDAAHTFHDWSGLIMLILGFVALFSLAKALGCRKFAGWDIF